MRRASRIKSRRFAFVAHSFASADAELVKAVKRTVRAGGYAINSGEAPAPKGVSEKVRSRIETADVFVAILTRRHRIRDFEWTTSPWVIEEKAYSFGHSKARPILLLVESGIVIPAEIGGINGDLEYVIFERYRLDLLRHKIKQLLKALS